MIILAMFRIEGAEGVKRLSLRGKAQLGKRILLQNEEQEIISCIVLAVDFSDVSIVGIQDAELAIEKTRCLPFFVFSDTI